MTASEKIDSIAANSAMTVAARACTILLTLAVVPLLGWSNSIGNRVTAIETVLSRIAPPAYTAESAAKDLAVRDVQIANLTDNVKTLAAVVGVIQQRQSDRIPLFDEMKTRLDRLEAAVFSNERKTP